MKLFIMGCQKPLIRFWLNFEFVLSILGAQNYICSMRITVMSLYAQANATWNSENKSYELGSNRVFKDRKFCFHQLQTLTTKLLDL
jgi:hypothetical protein